MNGVVPMRKMAVADGSGEGRQGEQRRSLTGAAKVAKGRHGRRQGERRGSPRGETAGADGSGEGSPREKRQRLTGAALTVGGGSRICADAHSGNAFRDVIPAKGAERITVSRETMS
jgi:hypothetical protein